MTQETESPITSWKSMIQRCLNPNHVYFENYGGRGITIDPSWESYANFRADMGRRPKGFTLERIDNSKGYSKENCKWATPSEQQRNRRQLKNNTSGVTGVSWDKARQRWIAHGTVDGIKMVLYRGPSKEAAIEARKSIEA